jgi:hypothetical protein
MIETAENNHGVHVPEAQTQAQAQAQAHLPLHHFNEKTWGRITSMFAENSFHDDGVNRMHNTAQCSAAQHSAMQYNTAQHNIVQYSTAQHSKYSTVQYCTM